jgi:hypothetical protein
MSIIYKLSNDLNKTMGLHFTIHIKIYVLASMQNLMVMWMQLMAFLKDQQHIVKKPSYG